MLDFLTPYYYEIQFVICMKTNKPNYLQKKNTNEERMERG